MSYTSAALAGQRAAEARMLDTFEIRVHTGTGWTYDKTLQRDVRPHEVLFTTAGRVPPPRLGPTDTEVGGRTATEVRRELHIPANSPAVPAGAVAVCTSIGPTTDPTLLGAELTLAGPTPGSQTTARRLQVTEVIT